MKDDIWNFMEFRIEENYSKFRDLVLKELDSLKNL